MKRPEYILLSFIYMFLPGMFLAQSNVSIIDNNTNPDASAMLHVQSTGKVPLIPRMTTAQRNQISNATLGLLVFDTTTNSFFFSDGNNHWTELGSITADATLTGDGTASSPLELATNNATEGQVMMDNNGAWKPMDIALSVPYIAIFEEWKPNAIEGGTVVGGAFNTRILNTIVKASPSVTLNAGTGLMTFVNGTYLITASAPAVQSDQHRLCLSTDNDVIVLFGTSELCNNSDATVMRSFINGLLTVPADGTVCKLNHFFDLSDGGDSAMGAPSSTG